MKNKKERIIKKTKPVRLIFKQIIVGVILTFVLSIAGALGGLVFMEMSMFSTPQFLPGLGVGYEWWGTVGSLFGIALAAFLSVWGIARLSKFDVKGRTLFVVMGIFVGFIAQLLLYALSLNSLFLSVPLMLAPLAGALIGFHASDW